MSDSRPVTLVLRPADPEADLRTPPGLQDLESEIEFRFATAENLGEHIGDADALFLWDFFSGALEQAWSEVGNLQWIHVAAAGVDSLLFDELKDSGVVVTNAQGTFDRPIAEWVLGAVLAQAKDFAGNYRYKSEKIWRHRETQRVQGCAALVIGTGAIGREIARLLRAIGMEVRGVGRTARQNDPDFGEVIASEKLADHVGTADVIVNAAPLTPQTTGLINTEVLAAVRTGAHLVNIGRGASVDEPALIEALQSGPLGFASLDVFAEEPLPESSPLWEMDNVLISAHMSGDVIGWKQALAQQFTDNARRWLRGEDLVNVVDKTKGYVPRH